MLLAGWVLTFHTNARGVGVDNISSDDLDFGPGGALEDPPSEEDIFCPGVFGAASEDSSAGSGIADPSNSDEDLRDIELVSDQIDTIPLTHIHRRRSDSNGHHASISIS